MAIARPPTAPPAMGAAFTGELEEPSTLLVVMVGDVVVDDGVVLGFKVSVALAAAVL